MDWKGIQNLKTAMENRSKAITMAIQRDGYVGKQMHFIAAYTYKVEGRLMAATDSKLTVQLDDGSIVEFPTDEVLLRWRRRKRDAKGRETDEEMV
jgi:hypothetical protein